MNSRSIPNQTMIQNFKFCYIFFKQSVCKSEREREGDQPCQLKVPGHQEGHVLDIQKVDILQNSQIRCHHWKSLLDDLSKTTQQF